MDRRSFLSSMLFSAAIPRLGWADAGNPAYLAAAREADGAYALYGLGDDGAEIFRIPLPERGHAATAHPSAPEAVGFARRPGRFALVIDCVAGRETHRLHSPEGRHFYGHGAFVEDGAVLVTPENDVETGQGWLGLWARDEGYARIGEIPSGGVGPHDILRLDGDVLVVANGGIRTHPDRGREKLNLETMRPNLSYLTLHGGIEEQVELEPELHLASIRHLAQAEGVVGFAMQWQGDLPDSAPLLGLHRRGEAPVLCAADMAEQFAMEGYAGSVAMSGGQVAITSPRGGRVHVFGMDGQFRASLKRADVCGVAPAANGGLLVTDGMGGVLRIRGEAMRPAQSYDRAWDNHLIRVG